MHRRVVRSHTLTVPSPPLQVQHHTAVNQGGSYTTRPQHAGSAEPPQRLPRVQQPRFHRRKCNCKHLTGVATKREQRRRRRRHSGVGKTLRIRHVDSLRVHRTRCRRPGAGTVSYRCSVVKAALVYILLTTCGVGAVGVVVGRALNVVVGGSLFPMTCRSRRWSKASPPANWTPARPRLV